ncbi:trigger factor [Holzapfeliella floricola]|uniref:Trigger factor n=1 Tax=Holzapfeliella floricola DSM 23037 = JCM 16512 TaxID=1423744 RepID=A0A0R2DT23_9LACO|nr:trigger factor [Holzapfeliella floricola]KRN03628.1 trigger factor [Holzapfeliella floricola DSM 23037 = JCM 16512]
MSAKWEKTGNITGELTFQISKEEVKNGLDKAFDRVKKNIDAPGFRKGKLPRTMFNRMYGEEALYEEALNIVLPEAYNNALQETGVEPVSQPEVLPESMERDADWEMKATVTVKPEVKLGEYKNLNVPKQDRKALVKEVNAELDKRRDQNAELVLKESGKAAKGDTVIIDFKGMIDGVAFDGGTAQNHSLELGSESFIPGFEDQLIGHSAGEDIDVVVTFPEDYQAEELAGKEAHFDTKIHEIKTKELPKLDDEFAKDIDDSVETLDELKEKIQQEIQQSKEEAAEDNIQSYAIQEAVDNAEITEVPQDMIDNEVNNQMNQYLGNMQRQGISPEMYFQITGTTQEDMKAQFAKDAEDRVKSTLVLEAIVKAEEIKPSKEEIDEEIKNLATQYNMEENVVRQTLTEDMLVHDISIKKAIALLSDTATEVVPSKLKSKKK